MGKLAGAAIKVAAPEAAAASKVAGKAGGKKPGPLRHQPTNLNDLPSDWHEEELQSRAADAKWASEERKAGRDPDRHSIDGKHEPGDERDEGQGEEQHQEQSDGGPGFGNPLGGMSGPATGGGFVLGLMVWALVRAYIGTPGQPSGPAGVKRLLAAKFLNKTS
jgi:hypothetical protein